MRVSIVVMLLTLCASPASSHGISVCQDRGPGTTKQAAPTIATFLGHMAKSMGEDASSFDGAYLNSRAACDAHAKANGSVFAVLDADTLLSHRADWKVEPIAHLGTAEHTVWRVLVRQGTLKNLADLSGKTVMSTAPGGSRFVSNLILDGAVKAEALTLKGTAKPLKALRNLARGKVDAAIVDQEAFAALAELNLPVALVVLGKSKPLPGLTLAIVEVGKTPAPASLVKSLKASLGKLCAGEGEKLCKTLGVRGFSRVAPGWWKRLSERYAR
jgi:hypothetical protein